MMWQLIFLFFVNLLFANTMSSYEQLVMKGETVEGARRRLSEIQLLCNPRAYTYSESACKENTYEFRNNTPYSHMRGGNLVHKPPKFLMSIQEPKKGLNPQFGSCYEHICSGALIAPNQVLTAAHCLQDLYSKIDKYGNIDEGTEIYVAQAPLCRHETGLKRLAIIKAFIYPDFDFYEKWKNDVAILETRGAFSGPYVDYQSAYNLSFEDKELNLFGYGKQGTIDKDYSRVQLRSINLKHMGDDFCRNRIIPSIREHFKPDIMLCTFSLKGKSCEGDSGGPLILNQTNIIVGINSWGNPEECSIHGPTVYTKVGSTNIVFWIDEIVHNFSKIHGTVQWVKPTPIEDRGISHGTVEWVQPPPLEDKNDNLPSSPSDQTDRGAKLDCSLAGSLECDLQALLYLKSKLQPSAQQFYSSWSGSDPCDGTWLNVQCKDVSNQKQFRVTKLQVGTGYYYQRGWYWYYRRASESVKFEQQLPVQLTQMQWMERLELHSAKFSGSIFPEISTMKNITVLTMGFSYITGTLPVEISELSRLQVVDLSSNQIEGTLSSGISKCSQIEVFDVDGNQLSGTLPPQISEFSSMTVLALSYNKISGSIPPQISKLSKRLYGVNLSYNKFIGTLPPEISVVSSLNRIQCQQNQIIGTVPPQYSVLSKTKILVFPQDGDLCLERKYESIVNDTAIIYC